MCSSRLISAVLYNERADYRVPQMLRSLGVLVYSPPLDYASSSLKEIISGHSWEVQLRGCSIWYELLSTQCNCVSRSQKILTQRRAVELIRREILRQHPEATNVNAVLIDFLLYDLAKEREATGESRCTSPCCLCRLSRCTPLGNSWSSELLFLHFSLSPFGLATGASMDHDFGVSTASGWPEVVIAKQFDSGSRSAPRAATLTHF